jgi:hypothetical protein
LIFETLTPFDSKKFDSPSIDDSFGNADVRLRFIDTSQGS